VIYIVVCVALSLFTVVDKAVFFCSKCKVMIINVAVDVVHFFRSSLLMELLGIAAFKSS
jgi:hypothetical protein